MPTHRECWERPNMIGIILTAIMIGALVVIFFLVLGVFALFDADLNPDK
jgi:hypothetical protein